MSASGPSGPLVVIVSTRKNIRLIASLKLLDFTGISIFSIFHTESM